MNQKIKRLQTIDNVLEQLDNVKDKIIQNDVKNLAIYLNFMKNNYEKDFENILLFIDKFEAYSEKIINKIKDIFKEISEKNNWQQHKNIYL